MIRNRLVLYYLFDILLMSSAFAGNPSLLCFAYVITQAYIKIETSVDRLLLPIISVIRSR